MMSPNIAVLFTLAIALIGVSPPSPAQDSASTPESVAASEVTPPRATDTKPEFDPALLGLSALTASPNSAERIEQALKQVDDRLAKIKQQNVPSNANQPQDEQPSDPRLEPLQALRLSLQRRATLLARHRELESSLADQKATQGTLQHEGEVKEPPHPVDELDQLYDEHRLAKHAAKAAERDLEAAQRQADTASKNVEDKDQERRLARSRLEQADPKTDVTGLERQLETTRLDVLAPRQGFAAAKEDLEVTRLDADLTRQRADLLSAKIARMKDDVSFTQAMLDKPFAELKARETQIHQRTWTLTRTANQAEGALFDARQDLAHNQDETRTPLLEEKVAARETELESARKGIAYLDDALASIACAPYGNAVTSCTRGRRRPSWPLGSPRSGISPLPSVRRHAISSPRSPRYARCSSRSPNDSVTPGSRRHCARRWNAAGRHSMRRKTRPRSSSASRTN